MGEAVDPEAAAGVLARVQAVHGDAEAAKRPERDVEAGREQAGERVVVEVPAARVPREPEARREGDARLHVGVVDVEAAAALAPLGALAARFDHVYVWGCGGLRVVEKGCE